MKIRSGFVSNSSSSSFILIASKELVEKTLEKMDEKETTAVILSCGEKINLFGKECIFFETFYDNGGYSNWDDFAIKEEFDSEEIQKIIYDSGASYSEFFGDFLNSLIKLGEENKDFFNHSIDF